MSKNSDPSFALEAFKRFWLTVAIVIAMFIPLWIFLGANAYLDPQTFAEKALMIMFGYIFLGAAQIWGLIFGIGAVIETWSD